MLDLEILDSVERMLFDPPSQLHYKNGQTSSYRSGLDVPLNVCQQVLEISFR
jgi:hypothetical protein